MYIQKFVAWLFVRTICPISQVKCYDKETVFVVVCFNFCLESCHEKYFYDIYFFILSVCYSLNSIKLLNVMADWDSFGRVATQTGV